MSGFGPVRDISEEELTLHLEVLFDEIITDLHKQRDKALDAAISESINQLEHELRHEVCQALTAEEMSQTCTPEIKNKMVAIMEPIKEKHRIKRKELITKVIDEEQIKRNKKIADTQDELKALFRCHFLLKERQKFAELTPSKYRCF